ncbi:MAG: hypothetical protein Q9219_007662 [cf. Caloplaca sp. 3 TL-2023]
MPWIPNAIQTFTTLLSLLVPVHAVSVILGGTRWLYKDYFGGTTSWTAGCTSLLPGECCLKPPHLIIDPGFTTFTSLSDHDIAFLWQSRPLQTQVQMRTARGCSGTPFRSHMGGPSWTYQWGNPNPFSDAEAVKRVAGASYLRLPPKVPPDGRESVWLGVEGLKGFVWGGGQWFFNGQGYGSGDLGWQFPRRDGGGVVFPGPQISRNWGVWRGGRFWAESPRRGKWVDWVQVNGSRYVDSEGEGARYRSAEGGILDFNNTSFG